MPVVDLEHLGPRHYHQIDPGQGLLPLSERLAYQSLDPVAIDGASDAPFRHCETQARPVTIRPDRQDSEKGVLDAFRAGENLLEIRRLQQASCARETMGPNLRRPL